MRRSAIDVGDKSVWFPGQFEMLMTYEAAFTPTIQTLLTTLWYQCLKRVTKKLVAHGISSSQLKIVVLQVIFLELFLVSTLF